MANKEKSADEPRAQRQPTAPATPESEAQASGAAKNCRDQDTQKAENNFDRDLVRWTKTVGVFTGFLFIAAVLQFCAMRGQWTVMQGQLAAMEADQRPWIGAPKIEPDNSAKIVSFRFTFKNVGKTPTKGIYIGAKTVEKSEKDMRTKSICERGRDIAKRDPKRFQKNAIMPNEDFIIMEPPGDIDVGIDLAKIEKRKIYDIVGCVIYGSPVDDVIHQTKFVAALWIYDSRIDIHEVYTQEPN